MKNPLFYAKIILFGEYGMIENSQGLVVPYSFYKGTLKFLENNTDFEKESNLHLKKYLDYLTTLVLPENFKLDIDTFKEDIEKGLFFDSNIPQGYGIGSSGALIAAIFDKYSIKKHNPNSINKEELKELKKVFSLLESYFHGTSSGMDPLICFMNLPFLIKNKENVNQVSLPKQEKGKGAIFLIDSGITGKTEPMIQIFFENLKNEGFRKTLKEEFIKYNNACIEAFIKKDFKPLFKNLKSLSLWALEHFKPMIPINLLKIWEKGIETDDYYLKLCGSGGGGFILGFTQDYQKIQKILKDYNTEIVYRF